MNCPRDAAVLEPKAIGDTSIATCPNCGGMYFAEGQLNHVIHPEHGDIEFSTVDRDSFQHDDDHGPFACPKDGTTMGKVDFNVDTSIILDYCTACRGFWIDGDELARIRDEVKELDAAGDEIPDPLLVRISQWLWNLPIPH